tara:strand:- start:1518 stop:1658 length:141 start_codon:yes stop_codon:yes gene_type:complete
MSGIDKFFQAIDDVTKFILGDKRSGNERRVKKSKRKTTRRKITRRK